MSLLTPEKYNEVCTLNNMNKIKARLHNQCYLNLEKKGKTGDLRIGDIENGKIVLVESLTGGLIHNRKKEHVICCLKDEEIYNKMLKYM